MFMHPANAAAVAGEHRRDLTAQARAARASRPGRFAILAALTAALVALGATPAFAVNHPLPIDPGTGASTSTPPVVHTVVIGGMPGWQIALIAAGAALLAAVLAVLADRARTARKAHPTTA